MFSSRFAPKPWRAWLLLAVALWVGFAPAGLAYGAVTAAAPSVTREANHSVAGDVCKYLYAHADLVGRIDPSGHMSISSVFFAAWSTGIQAMIAFPRVTAALYATGKAIAAVAAFALPAANVYLFATNEEFKAIVVNTPGGVGLIAADVKAVMSVSRMVYEARFAILIAVEREAGYIAETVPINKALKADLYHSGGGVGSSDGYMGIDFRRRQSRMSQHLLDVANVGPALQHVSRHRMSE